MQEEYTNATLGRLVGRTPVMTLYTTNEGVVSIIDTHIVPEKENSDKKQPSGDIRLEDVVCVFPLKKDVIRIQWRRKNDTMPLYHHDFMFARDFKLDLKSMYPDKKLRKEACPALCRKIIEQINAHHNRKINDGWFVLQQYEQVEKSFPARTKYGKGTAYLTNLGISFEHESKGMMFWMGYNQLISWKVFKKRSIKLEHEYVFTWKNTGKQELLTTNFDLRIEDKTDPELLCDVIKKCYGNSGVDEIRDRDEIKEIMKSWKAKEFLDYGTFEWFYFYHTDFEERLQKVFRGEDRFLQSKLSDAEIIEKRSIAQKYQNYCLWYVREKLLGDEYEPVIATHSRNELANCKTYPRIENYLLDLLVRCHTLSIPIKDVFKFSDSFKETLKRGNVDVHKWSKENDICLEHLDQSEAVCVKYQKLDKLIEALKDKEFIFHEEQSKKHSLRQFASENWKKLCEEVYWDYDSKGRILLDKDGIPVRHIVNKPGYYNRNLGWTERYHPEAPDYICDVLYRNLYDIWKKEHPLTEHTSDEGLSWMNYQMDDLPYDIEKINYDNELVNEPKTKPLLKSFKDKAIVNSKKLESFVMPDKILKDDILSADCFYYYKDKIWFTRNPDAISLLEDVATISKNECETKYGFIGLGFSEDKIQMVGDVPAAVCSENVIAELEYVNKPAPILLKFITDDELTFELMDKYANGEIYFSCLSMEYSLCNDGECMHNPPRWNKLRTKQRQGEEMLPLAERMRRNKFHMIIQRPIFVKKEDYVNEIV